MIPGQHDNELCVRLPYYEQNLFQLINITHVFKKIRVRYFKLLVYKEKTLVRMHQGFLF
jgi:hypothetical protein